MSVLSGQTVFITGAARGSVSATVSSVEQARGYYLLMSSAAAFGALPGMAAYAAAKAGVEQFGNVLRLELAHRGVAVGTAHGRWCRQSNGVADGSTCPGRSGSSTPCVHSSMARSSRPS
ncbi:MAG TPA: SDR family NAD(P)-dependent oxidoreductase [Micromonosporaceae bacterium]|jgi:NAD(P)-dependent dehydrogenase (short-subunit alcohol dehydrogenase family)